MNFHVQFEIVLTQEQAFCQLSLSNASQLQLHQEQIYFINCQFYLSSGDWTEFNKYGLLQMQFHG